MAGCVHSWSCRGLVIARGKRDADNIWVLVGLSFCMGVRCPRLDRDVACRPHGRLLKIKVAASLPVARSLRSALPCVLVKR